MAQSTAPKDVREAWDCIKKYVNKNGKNVTFTSSDLKKVYPGINGHVLSRLKSQNMLRSLGKHYTNFQIYALGDKLMSLSETDILTTGYNRAAALSNY